MNPRLVLGSASPRRAALLEQIGLPFEKLVSPDSEPLPCGQSPPAFVRLSALAKARAVRRLLAEQGRQKGALVIGADTIVCLDGAILGKPDSPRQAASMLGKLSGRTHEVHTGVALLLPGGQERCEAVRTRVHMRPLRAADIDAYVASGEPLDKAGAYGIQGRGARFIESIEGCYYNVVGLPLARLCALLEEAGYDFAATPAPQDATSQ